MLAIGLAILNLTCLALLASQLPITRHPPGSDAPASLAGEPNAAPAFGEARRWTAY